MTLLYFSNKFRNTGNIGKRLIAKPFPDRGQCLLFSMFLIIWHLGTCWSQSDPASQGQTIPTDMEMKTNQCTAHSQPPPLWGSHIQAHYSPALLTQGQVPDDQGRPLCPEPLKYLTLAKPESNHPASCLFLPTKITLEVPAHRTPLPLPLVLTRVSPMVSLPLKSIRLTNHLFHSSHLLTCASHHIWITIKPTFEKSDASQYLFPLLNDRVPASR